MKYNQKEIGDRVRLLRLKSKLTQTELAKKLNSSKSVISRLENGVYKKINPNLLSRYSVYFRVSYFSVVWGDHDIDIKEEAVSGKIKAFFSKIKRWF